MRVHTNLDSKLADQETSRTCGSCCWNRTWCGRRRVMVNYIKAGIIGQRKVQCYSDFAKAAIAKEATIGCRC